MPGGREPDAEREYDERRGERTEQGSVGRVFISMRPKRIERQQHADADAHDEIGVRLVHRHRTPDDGECAECERTTAQE